MKLTLNVWERQMLVNIVGLTRGPVAIIRKASKALDVLELSTEEKEEVNFRVLPGGNQQWEATNKTYILEIKDLEAVALVRRAFKEFDQWVAADRTRILGLEAKLQKPKSKSKSK